VLNNLSFKSGRLRLRLIWRYLAVVVGAKASNEWGLQTSHSNHIATQILIAEALQDFRIVCAHSRQTQTPGSTAVRLCPLVLFQLVAISASHTCSYQEADEPDDQQYCDHLTAPSFVVFGAGAVPALVAFLVTAHQAPRFHRPTCWYCAYSLLAPYVLPIGNFRVRSSR